MSTLALFLGISLGACDWRAKAPDPTETPQGTNAYQIVTGEDSEDERSHWDAFLNRAQYVYGKEPAPFLKENIHVVRPGRALDIAMGEGRNAVFLAKRGFQVDGVDISEVAIRKALRLARENHVTITPVHADLNKYQIPPDTYDLIVVVNFLSRPVIPILKRGLKRGGYVIYENYTIDQLGNALGQNLRRDWLFQKGELREFFKDFEVLVYKETNDGKDALASVVARKP